MAMSITVGRQPETRPACMFCYRVTEAPVGQANAWRINCEICGPDEVTRELLADGPQIGKEGYLVFAWLRWAALENNDQVQLLTQEKAQQIAKEAPRYTPLEKANQLLLALGRITKRPGGMFQGLIAQLTPFAWARDEREVTEYLDWLDTIQINRTTNGIKLTIGGWEKFEQLQTNANNSGRRAFVAMWFDDSMDFLWTDGLRPGIEDAGYQPYRVKGVVHGDRIDAHIIAEIRACPFVVADVTGSRTAVYFEAGFADALGKPVIWPKPNNRVTSRHLNLSIVCQQSAHCEPWPTAAYGSHDINRCAWAF